MIRAWPVVFSGPMVRALLDGRKTQTRRLPTPMWHAVARHQEAGGECWLWVREKIGLPFNPAPSGPVYYCADRHFFLNARFTIARHHPSIHMPRWASRLSLKVEAIRLERLQEISYEDCRDEAATCTIHGDVRHVGCTGLKAGFSQLWNDLHYEAGKPGTHWDDNPTVFAVRFTVHRRNINDILAAKEAA